MPSDRPVLYRIYLLTCWLDADDQRANPEVWRFRLEEPRCSWRHGYVGVTALVAGLISVIGNDEEEEEEDV